MRKITTTVYNFDELNAETQEQAIEKLWDINVKYEWWDGIYSDAEENARLKITSFDIDRGSYCKAEFIHDAINSAALIKENCGNETDIYQLAETFQQERDEIILQAPKDENGDFEYEHEVDGKLDDLEADFLKDLCEEYLSSLRKEYEYQTSEQAIKETIEINNYEFTIDGDLI